jgi:formylglycine-generating enzyme required for sulfatase activity
VNAENAPAAIFSVQVLKEKYSIYTIFIGTFPVTSSLAAISIKGEISMNQKAFIVIGLFILILTVLPITCSYQDNNHQTVIPTPTITPTPFLGNSGDIYATDPIIENLRFVRAGTFMQGSPVTEKCRWVDETQFSHTLTMNFALMESEVTGQMWMNLKQLQPDLPEEPNQSNPMNYPVQGVPWKAAIVFANLLSIQNGLTPCYYSNSSFINPIRNVDFDLISCLCNFASDGYRLPSEGEWEYACRAGSTTAYYNGLNNNRCEQDSNLDLIAWYWYNSNGAMHPGGIKQSNAWFLNDMVGNAWEWCWDIKAVYPGDSIDYTGPDPLPPIFDYRFRIVRGGAWSFEAGMCRSACRFSAYTASDYGFFSVGFRLARTVQ